MAEKFDILVDPPYRNYCKDYEKDGKKIYSGCGQEVKVIKVEDFKGNVTSAVVEPVQLLAYTTDFPGKPIWVNIPHRYTCVNQKEFHEEKMREKAVKDDKFAKSGKSSGERGRGPRAAM